jgi:hypothetical protein
MRVLIVQVLGLIVVCGALASAGPLAQRMTMPQTMPQCDVGRWPEFNYGFAALRLDLGTDMGDAVECEHTLTASGDTDQQTTTGVAHYDRATNTPSFHQGTDNWALTLQGLVFWSGNSPEIPSGTVAIPSPGSARMEAMREQNSAPAGTSLLGGGRRTPVPTTGGTLLTKTQIGRIAALVGISDEKLQTMTLDDLSQYFQKSGGSVSQMARSMNTDSLDESPAE